MHRLLKDILPDSLIVAEGAEDIKIEGVTADSRKVAQSFLFAALSGLDKDGADYIPAALEQGAAVLLVAADKAANIAGEIAETYPDVVVIPSRDPRSDYARITAAFFNAQPDFMVAVTGTNGKTSVADFTRQIWKDQGLLSASLGTLGIRSDLMQTPGGLTTPDPVKLHQSLSQIVTAGVTHCALEASSHGLDQKRLEGVNLRAAAFTNLSRDHLDYHHNEEGYFQAKARLFHECLMPGAMAVINTDGPRGAELAEQLHADGKTVVTVGRAVDATVRILDIETKSDGLSVTILSEGVTQSYNLKLLGSFQAENAVLAALLASTAGLPVQACLKSMEHLHGVSGRMQYVGTSVKGGSVYVDFAHTPDGLETVLKAARSHAAGSLDVVFGCGGNRDRGKRSMMGDIACRLADKVYVTDDNPRFEDAAMIRQEICEACDKAMNIPDREEAIGVAVDALRDGDILILAGKGHEEGQIVGDKKIPFSDILTAQRLIRGK